MLGRGKRTIGVFRNHENAESAINALRMSNFPMDKVSLVAQDANQDHAITSSQSKLIRTGIKGFRIGESLAPPKNLLLRKDPTAK